MTYTREQLEAMSNLDLNTAAYSVTDYQLPHEYPSTSNKGANWMQYMATDRDASCYLDYLCSLTVGEEAEFWEDDHIVAMLRATPRERTIAAILTWQGGAEGE